MTGSILLTSEEKAGGTRKDKNVFAIQTPVAIFVGWRMERGDSTKPAAVRYTRIEGPRKEKLDKLASIKSSSDLAWKKVPSDWLAPFRPRTKGNFMDWPLLTDLIPWQYSGIETKRPWPIAPDKDTVVTRWAVLLTSNDKQVLMKESGDRTIELGQSERASFAPLSLRSFTSRYPDFASSGLGSLIG